MIALTLALLLSQTAEEAAPPPAEVEKPAEPEKPPEAEKPAEPPPAPEPSPWSANLNAGITWVTGNVISFSFVGAAAATRKTDKTIFITKLFAAYGEKFGPLPEEVILLNAGLTAQFDYRFNPTFSMFIGAGVDTDHIKSVEVRGYGEVGVGATWVDTKMGEPGKEIQRALVKTDLSIRVQPESRFQYYPVYLNVEDAFILGPRLAAIGHYAWSASTYVHEEVEVLPNVLGKSRFLMSSSSKVAVGIVSKLSATATFTVKADTAPADGKRPVDTIFTLGAEANF